MLAKQSFFKDSPQHSQTYKTNGFTKESASFKYTLTVFYFDLSHIFLIETMFFLPLFIKLSIPTCFFPNCVKVKPKQLYCFAIWTFLSLQQNLNSMMFAPCLLKITLLVFLCSVCEPTCNSIIILKWIDPFQSANLISTNTIFQLQE